jgi:siroheme decarboxylase
MRTYDPTERAIINGLQGGFPLSHQPFRDAGHALGLTEGELLDGLRQLAQDGCLGRFGPLWNAEGIGGAVGLCAMAVPNDCFEQVAAQVNAYREVAHNYERDHEFNMWFVISAEHPSRIAEVIAGIEVQTGIKVYPMPKAREFRVGFKVEV